MFDIRNMQQEALYHSIREASNETIAEEIVYGGQSQALTEDHAAWVKNTMKRLETKFDQTSVQKIRMRCQCGYGMDEKLALLKELTASSGSLEDFAGQDKAKQAGLFCTNGELFLQFQSCPCPMLAQVDRLETDTWCQCTTGYSKVLFEKAFGCEVEVQLIKSVKMGDDKCLMKIVPQRPVWKNGLLGK